MIHEDDSIAVASTSAVVNKGICRLHHEVSNKFLIMNTPLCSETELVDNQSYDDQYNEFVAQEHLLLQTGESSNSCFETKITNAEALMHLLKGSIGIGILSIPSSLEYTGLLGMIGIVLTGLICVYCMRIFLRCNRILCKRTQTCHMNYQDIAEKVFEKGPACFKPHSGKARFLVHLMHILTQFEFCVAYFFFVSVSVREITVNLANDDVFGEYGSFVLVLILMIPYIFIQSLKHLAVVSTIANVVQIFGLFVIYCRITHDLPPISSRPLSVPIYQLPLFFGIMVHCFEAVGVVAPIQNEMQRPADFVKWNGELNTGMALVTCFYTAIGFYGYLKYGSQAKDNITLNLGSGITDDIVQITFALAILLSYGLQLHVLINITWPGFRKIRPIDNCCKKAKIEKRIKYCFRIMIICCTFGLAAIINNVEYLVSLVGAIAGSLLAIVFPAFLDIIIYYNEDIAKWKYILLIIVDVVLILFGLAGLVTGTYVCGEKIYNCVVHHHDCGEG